MATTRRPAAKTAAKPPVKRAAAKRTTARTTTRKSTTLSVVPDKPADQGETPVEAPPKATSIAEAARSGTQRELLEATRDRIARALDDPKCPPRDLASLTKRLTDIADTIAALDLRAKEEGADSEQIPDDDTYGAASI